MGLKRRAGGLNGPLFRLSSITLDIEGFAASYTRLQEKSGSADRSAEPNFLLLILILHYRLRDGQYSYARYGYSCAR